MGWADTNNKRQHVQVMANAWDMQRIEEMNRRRRGFIFLDIFLVICILIGVAYMYAKDYTTGFIFLAIGIVILLYLILRKKRRKNSQRFQRHKKFRRRRR